MKDTSEDTRDLADGVVVPEEPVLHQEVLVEGALLVLDVVEEAVETRHGAYGHPAGHCASWRDLFFAAHRHSRHQLSHATMRLCASASSCWSRKRATLS